MVALFPTTFLYSPAAVFPNPTATSADTHPLAGSPLLTHDGLALNLPLSLLISVCVTQMSPGAALFKFLYSNQFVVQMVPTPKLKQEIASYAYETLKTLDIIRPPLYSKGVPEFWEQNYMVFIE